MARGLFITGFNIAEVIAIQARAKEMLMEGKTIMNWNDAETSTAKQFTMPVDHVLEECGYALRVLDPENYARKRNVSSSIVSGYLSK